MNERFIQKLLDEGSGLEKQISDLRAQLSAAQAEIKMFAGKCGEYQRAAQQALEEIDLKNAQVRSWIKIALSAKADVTTLRKMLADFINAVLGCGDYGPELDAARDYLSQSAQGAEGES